MRARGERPILLSIGYSACHWCHVMERESFEDEATAEYMNEHFVRIKLDREERPDLDSIYMEACQAMTGRGGWPLNVFLTPGAGAVLRGHVLPARGAPRHAELARGPRGRGRRRGTTSAKRSAPAATASPQRLQGGARPPALGRAARRRDARRRRSSVLRKSYDPVTAASAARPKFPPASAIEFLLRRGETEMTTRTLQAMAAGGMYDQVGGGFARYSVDAALARPPLREDALRQRAARPRLPARLAGDRRAAVPRASARRPSTGRCARCAAPRAASTRRSTPTPRAWRASSTSGPPTSCAPCSATTPTRRRVLRRDGRAATSRARTSSRAATDEPGRRRSSAQRLYDARAERVWPGLDDKRLTAWNALMIAALADAGAVLERAGLPRRGDRLRGLRARRAARRATGACCAPGRTARPS